MTFINKVVGLTGTTTPPPAGALLVNDLPIISTAFATAIAKIGDTNPIDNVWNRTIINSETAIREELYNLLMKEMQFRQLISSSLDFMGATGSRNRSARYEGARYQLSRSRHTKITFKEVYVAGSGTFNVRIFDLVTGTQVYEKLAVTTAGEMYIPIDFSANIDKLENDLFACIDASGIDLKQMNANRGFLSDSSGGYNVQVSSGYINFAQAINQGNFTQSASFVHFVVDIEADIINFLTTNAQIIATPAWYLCGYQLLQDSLSSDNFNIWTNTNWGEREKNAAINYNMYRKFIKECIQPIMMKLAPTQQIATKGPEEKPGIQKYNALAGSAYDYYDDYPDGYYPG